MNTNVRDVGLDVHAESIVIAVADVGEAPAAIWKAIPYDLPRLLKELKEWGRLSNLKVCYEAGPTGFGLQRFLAAHGVECLVVAPSLVPVHSGSRVKTDRAGARKLAHFLRSGDLTPIWIPDEHTEAVRDLERAREDARLAERRARQQLLKFLLRHGRRPAWPVCCDDLQRSHGPVVRESCAIFDGGAAPRANTIGRKSTGGGSSGSGLSTRPSSACSRITSSPCGRRPSACSG